MGLDPARFPNEVDEELICPICSWVFNDPVQTSSCEHAFCRSCIQEWLARRSTCPVDRQAISLNSLGPVPRILRNLLSRQLIYCENKEHGCTTLIRLDGMEQHLNECEFSPQKLIECSKGCGASVAKDKISEHNCLLDLRCLFNSHENRLEDYQRTLTDQATTIENQERKLKELEERVKVLLNVVKLLLNDSGSRISIMNTLSNSSNSNNNNNNNNNGELVIASSLSNHPSLLQGAELFDDDEEENNAQCLQIWASSLPEAVVTRWGGMISTPDSVLQVVIKRALTECGCPPAYVDPLMERAHERHWPPGLESLDVRQLNRRQYDNYLCRRVPGKQAVVILALDNRHMPLDMVASPGIIMIFAHGVETA